MKKLVLAYSGGLDTSYCAVHLSKDLGFEVHAVSVNTGGFTQEEINTIKDKSLAIGASTYQNIEAKTTYYNKVVKYLIFGNVLKNNTYPLSVSAERIIQAVEIIEYAKSIGAQYIAHGSTGAGNDQVRFDMIFQILATEINIITPIRDNSLSREELIDHNEAWSAVEKDELFVPEYTKFNSDHINKEATEGVALKMPIFFCVIKSMDLLSGHDINCELIDMKGNGFLPNTEASVAF